MNPMMSPKRPRAAITHQFCARVVPRLKSGGGPKNDIIRFPSTKTLSREKRPAALSVVLRAITSRGVDARQFYAHFASHPLAGFWVQHMTSNSANQARCSPTRGKLQL